MSREDELRDIRRAHRMRLAAWGVPVDRDYEYAVADRALACPPPESHPHAHDEMGMCLECDAAAALDAIRRAVG